MAEESIRKVKIIAGAAAGTTLGAAFGGPVGAIAGFYIGGLLGGWFAGTLEYYNLIVKTEYYR